MAKVSEGFAKVRGRFEQGQAWLQRQPAELARLANQHGEIDTLMQRTLNASANRLRESDQESPLDSLYASLRSKLLELLDVDERGLHANVQREDLRPLIARAKERHDQLREVLARLERAGIGHVAWDEELRQLSLIFRQHVREQREELFPQLGPQPPPSERLDPQSGAAVSSTDRR